MNTLFEKSIRTLELPAVLSMLAALAVSDAAKEKCRSLMPVCDLEEALHLQAETQSARERLGLEYIDLFLLHWPYGDAAGAWRALEELYRQGRVRAIGVCNFTRPYLDKLLQTAEILPAVDQMECHPLLQLPELRRYLAQKGIQPEAWSPVGRMHPELTGSPVLGALAQKHGKSLAQIILRWHLQEGIVAIPKAAGEEKIRQNIDILDFELSEEEMAAIRAMDRGFHTNDDPDDPTSEGRLASRPTGF